MSTPRSPRTGPQIPASPPRFETLHAYVVLTGRGPILVMALLAPADHPRLRQELARRGFDSYIAWSVPCDDVRRAYGPDVEALTASLDAERPLRVVDFDGRRVFHRLSLSHLDEPVVCQRSPAPGEPGFAHRL